MDEEKRQGNDFENKETVPVRRPKLFSTRDLRASTIGWEIAIPIVGGPLLGFFIDRRYDTDALWTLILLGVGVISAVASVIKYLRYEFYLMNKKLEEDQKKGIKREWRDYDDVDDEQ